MTDNQGDVDRAAVLNRVKRAQGQLGGVLRMIEEGRDLEAVLGQIKAVSRALDRAGLAMVAADWRAGADVGDVTPERIDRLERLILSVT